MESSARTLYSRIYVMYSRCIESSAGQRYSRIYVMYIVWRVMHDDSFIQEYMVCTLYSQCMESSAGQRYSRIYVMYSVWRVVHDSFIQEYMVCTLYSQCMKSSAGQRYSRIYVMYSVWRVVHDSCIQEYIYGGKWIYKEPPFVGVYPRAEYLHNNGVHRHTLRHTDMNSTVQKTLLYCYFLIYNISCLSSINNLGFFNLT